MSKITKEYIRRIYGVASSMGMVAKNGDKDDDLHALVYGLTGKESISALTEQEAKAVIVRLIERSDQSRGAGRIPAGQIKKAWKLIYRLAELSPRSTEPGARMVGAIKKIVGVDAERRDPFRWITAEQGNTLVEGLKRYVATEERRKKERDKAHAL